MNYTRLAAFALLTIFSFSFCKKDKKDPVNNTPAPGPSSLPVVATSPITQLNDSIAVCGGTVSSEGASAITEVGVCWDTLPSPTTARMYVSNAGAGVGNFTSILTNLKLNKKYYVRAFAKNSNGTAYGAEINFTSQVKSWEKASNLTNDILCMVSSGSTIFAGTVNGIVFSADNGDTWSPKGLNGVYIFALHKNGNSLFATTLSGELFRSTDNGSSWQDLTPNFPYYPNVNCVTTLGSRVFASTDSSVFVSSDNGGSWSRISNGLYKRIANWSGGYTYNLMASAQNVYTFCFDFAPSGSPTYLRSLFKYDESANKWENVLDVGYDYVNSNVVCGNKLFVSTFVNGPTPSGKVQLSENAGSTWLQFNSKGCKIEVHESNIIMSDVDFMTLSLDGGNTWSNVNYSRGIPTSASNGYAFISDNYLWMNVPSQGVYRYKYR